MMLFFLAPLLILIPAALTLTSQAHRYVEQRAEADAQAARLADSLTAKIATIHRLNFWLEALHVECLALTLFDPTAQARIAAEGQTAQTLQEMQHLAIEAEIRLYSLEERLEWIPESRGPPRACRVPAPLKLTRNFSQIFRYESRLAGIRISAKNERSPPRWVYFHPLVSRGS